MRRTALTSRESLTSASPSRTTEWIGIAEFVGYGFGANAPVRVADEHTCWLLMLRSLLYGFRSETMVGVDSVWAASPVWPCQHASAGVSDMGFRVSWFCFSVATPGAQVPDSAPNSDLAARPARKLLMWEHQLLRRPPSDQAAQVVAR